MFVDVRVLLRDTTGATLTDKRDRTALHGPCPHAQFGWILTTRVSSPIDWTVRIGSHTQQGMVTALALPRLEPLL